jgi:hypothetical protein
MKQPVQKKRRASRIQRIRNEQINKLEVRRNKLIIEQSLVRRTKTLMTKIPMLYRTSGKAIIWFDYLFLEIEPNIVKRRNRLKRIFNLRPISGDKPYIDIMIKEAAKYRKKSRKLGIKHGLIKINS